MTPDILITRIKAFADKRGIAPATVTSRAVQNSRLYDRLASGGSCTLRVATKLEQWMAEQEAAMPEDRQSAA